MSEALIAGLLAPIWIAIGAIYYKLGKLEGQLHELLKKNGIRPEKCSTKLP